MKAFPWLVACAHHDCKIEGAGAISKYDPSCKPLHESMIPSSCKLMFARERAAKRFEVELLVGLGNTSVFVFVHSVGPCFVELCLFVVVRRCPQWTQTNSKSIPEQLVVRQLQSTYLKPVSKEGPNRS